jgi:hypothetical protein
MAQIEIGQDQFVLEGREFRRLLECEAILKAVEHTLSLHGKVDADTPLHRRITATLTGGLGGEK